MTYINTQIAEMLRQIAAAYTIKGGNQFQIRAYETAADSIEHSTTEVFNLWQDHKLSEIPGIGPSLEEHLNELFKTGHVKHWEQVKDGIPSQTFDFLEIPGIGPKTAVKLSELGVKSVDDLKHKIKTGRLVEQGFSAKIAENIMSGLEEMGFIKSGRMLLSYAYIQAEQVLEYLKRNKSVVKADALGSLRRMVATIGDLDFAVASEHPTKVIKHITHMPGVDEVIDEGERKVSVLLKTGLRLDFLIAKPDYYGATLQHFTGSKLHNIHLRTIAEEKGLSLSEYGVKHIKTGGITATKTEEDLYRMLGMQTPPPEIREDTGETEAALSHNLPQLIESNEIKGDLHTHSNFPLEPSHGPGAGSIEEVVSEAKRLGYKYLGLADHPPSFTNHTQEKIIELIKKRTKHIENINYSNKEMRVLNLLEIDILPNGTLSVPNVALETLDFALAGVHSSHNQDKNTMTKRILKALENPYVKVLTHPTGRLLNERNSFEADWPAIFKFAAQHKKTMEINGYPNRLDLPDQLVREAKKYGVKFVINTDSHDPSQMINMRFGVAVARRGWCEKEDVINTWDWKKFADWFMISV